MPHLKCVLGKARQDHLDLVLPAQPYVLPHSTDGSRDILRVEKIAEAEGDCDFMLLRQFAYLMV